jgi:hypothetical protein
MEKKSNKNFKIYFKQKDQDNCNKIQREKSIEDLKQIIQEIQMPLKMIFYVMEPFLVVQREKIIEELQLTQVIYYL